MGFWGFTLLLLGALAIGVGGQYLGRWRYGYAWLLYAIGAVAGGFIASEYLGDASTWGWKVDGLYVLPALIGAVIIGGVLEAVLRLVTGERPRTPTTA